MSSDITPGARLRHIVVEGPIGVGKTSLAKRLAAHIGAALLLEKPEDNPFLARFYAEAGRHALATQLHFLLQRVDQLRRLPRLEAGGRAVVGDFLIDKDALFASLTLDPEELGLYGRLHADLAGGLPAPDLVIWLQAPVRTLAARVRRRAIPMERAITEDHLGRLCEAYAHHFGAYDAAPLLAVDTERFDPAHVEADFEHLVARLAAFHGPRETLTAPPQVIRG